MYCLCEVTSEYYYMNYHPLFPDYRSHPKFQQMPSAVGLDKESIAKLEVTPLPF